MQALGKEGAMQALGKEGAMHNAMQIWEGEDG